MIDAAAYGVESGLAGYAQAGSVSARALAATRESERRDASGWREFGADRAPSFTNSRDGRIALRSTSVGSAESGNSSGDPVARANATTENRGGVRGSSAIGGDEARSLFSAHQAGETQKRGGQEVGPDGLTDSERREVERLKARDREVREHEQAHVAAGGPYVSAPSYRFVRGPDGQFYAVGGEVRIDSSPVPGNPQATIRKMEVVKRAALAPREPSAQDRRVASQAEAQSIRARRQITEMERAEASEAAEKRSAQLDEQMGRHGDLPSPGSEPAFDPEARFRHAVGGIGALPGSGLVGAGALEVGLSGTLDAGALFNLVA